MANTPISGFTSGAPAQSGDEYVIARGGANFKLAGSDIKTLVIGAGSASIASGKTLTVNNTLTLSGTDGSTFNIGTGGSVAALATTAIGYTILNGDTALSTGIAGTGVQVPFSCTINSVTLLANVSGSVVIDIWKDTYANFPPTVADSICASAKPTLSSAQKSENTTLTGWTTTINAGDVLYFNVDSATTISNVLLTLKVTKT